MTKELRFFVVNADHPDLWDDIIGSDISLWQEDYELGFHAKKFIEIARKENCEYSYKGFMVAFNINEEVGMNDWIFITDKY